MKKLYSLFVVMAFVPSTWSQGAGVCERNPDVQSAIIARSSTQPYKCDQVTDADLARITSLVVFMNGGSLKETDLAGLTEVTDLRISHINMKEYAITLDRRLFSPLAKLRRLIIDGLSETPSDLLNPLPELESLWLSSYSALPAELLSRQTSLKELKLTPADGVAIANFLPKNLLAPVDQTLQRLAVKQVPLPGLTPELFPRLPGLTEFDTGFEGTAMWVSFSDYGVKTLPNESRELNTSGYCTIRIGTPPPPEGCEEAQTNALRAVQQIISDQRDACGLLSGSFNAGTVTISDCTLEKVGDPYRYELRRRLRWVANAWVTALKCTR